MAVKTIWPIDHTCGHHADRDLSDRRAGFVEWLQAGVLSYLHQPPSLTSVLDELIDEEDMWTRGMS
ncbi:hypothetical protein ACFYSH_28640 [Streptomyces sp. NPDC005791]|uniref:hypothetical protein n=1 Tax=unclassified Streptomyces TaxID=2593676 RepID=UPI0015E18D9B|nr:MULTISPECIES: hypothetical protein [unclassified Streptomyces]